MRTWRDAGLLLLMTGIICLGVGRLLNAAPFEGQATPKAASKSQETKVDPRTVRFLRMGDLAATELQKPITRFVERQSTDSTTHHMPFFEDAHAARALCVAFDLTGDRRYLDACTRWADQTVEFQSRMIPAGAYYMNYDRAPGQDRGEWNVADSGSIGMGVLATAVRCAGRDPQRHDRYLRSAKSFAKLVMDNYIAPQGGITNGCWSGYAGPWWCSTATAGSLLFLLHEETGDARYLRAGCGALDWTVRQDFYKVKPITFQQRPSGVIFYCFELYAVGLKHLKPGTESHRLAMAQLAEVIRWMGDHPIRQAPTPNYRDFDIHVDMAGLPYLKYIFARQLPQYRCLASTADQELERIDAWLFHQKDPPVSQLIPWEVMTWGMLSYAERLSPGALYRRSRGVSP